MKLSGKQLKEIQETLLDAFPTRDELRMMLRFELDEKLEAIADGTNQRVLIFNLVTWAERNGRIDHLVHGACNHMPGNPALQQLQQTRRSAGSIQITPLPAIIRTGAAVTVGPVAIDVFLSYSRQDSEAMRATEEILRSADLSVWTDEGLEPGTESWTAAIQEAVDQAPVMVVLLSPAAKASTWVEREITYVQTFSKHVYPILISGDARSAVPIGLIATQRVDGRQDLSLALRRDLLPVLLRQLGRSQTAPAITVDSGVDQPTIHVNARVDTPTVTNVQRRTRRETPDVLPEILGVPEPAPKIEFDWVKVRAGYFLMGGTPEKGDEAPDHEFPQDQVYVAAFRISRFLVTNAEYEKFVDATGADVPDDWTHGRIPPGKENHPVVYISWRDAQAFCTWAGVRLPTEAEWEKAARGTDGRIYPWGNNPPTADLANFSVNIGGTTPVGSYPQGASPYGVLDMAGNVWEWTSSQYQPYPYDVSDGRENPVGDDNRVLRGGSWLNDGNNVRCELRLFNLPDDRDSTYGFRVASSDI